MRIKVTAVGFRECPQYPEDALLQGFVIDADEPIATDQVSLTMRDTADDRNRLIQDLITGAEDFDVPRCTAGAVIEFDGCEHLAGLDFSARSYSVLSPSGPTRNLPEPWEDFVREWTEQAAPKF